jgi:hypothetical protein
LLSLLLATVVLTANQAARFVDAVLAAEKHYYGAWEEETEDADGDGHVEEDPTWDDGQQTATF